MRSELHEIERIEEYLSEQLSPEMTRNIDAKINTDPAFAALVEQQQLIVEANLTLGLRQTAKASYATYKWNTFLKFGISALGALALSVYIVVFFVLPASELHVSENILYPDNENGKNHWADADLYIQPQFFTVQTDVDNVVVGRDGIVIAVPQGAFVDAHGKVVTGNIEIELKEALTPEDIIAGGLSTTSGNQLLETGGMFYFNARKNGKNLRIAPDKGIAVDIPTNAYKQGMKLYKGVRLEDGVIDWRDPVELDHTLMKVDIHSLNFYPARYEDKLAAMGYGDQSKSWKDSVYYSFSGYTGAWPETEEPIVGTPKEPIAAIPSAVMEVRQLGMEEFLSISDTIDDTQIADSVIADSVIPENIPVANATTPLNSDTSAYDESFAIAYQIDPAKIKAIWNDRFQDTYIATREFEQRLQALFTMCSDEMLDLYINNIGKELYYTDSIIVTMLADPTSIIGEPVDQDVDSPNDHKSPGDTVAIEDNDKKTRRLFNEQAKKFQQFAAQHAGGIAVSSEGIRVLHQYYAQQTKAQQQAAAKTQQRYRAQYEKISREIRALEADEQLRAIANQETLYRNEYQRNLDEAYRQLGMREPAENAALPGRAYTAIIAETGWKNIDVAIAEITYNRQSGKYTSNDGGEVSIMYSELAVTISNEADFDRINVYALPHEWNAYQRITTRKGDAYSEQLNDLIDYDLLVVGFKGDSISIASENDILPGAFAVQLMPSGLELLAEALPKRSHPAIQSVVGASITNQFRKRVLQKSLEPYKNSARMRRELARVIFPCYETPAMVDQGVRSTSEDDNQGDAEN